MLDEQHGQDRDRETIRLLRARLDYCEARRAGTAAAAARDRDAGCAEIRMLKARIADLVRLLAAVEEAVPQIREAGLAEGRAEGRAQGHAEGWQAGYDQRAAEEGPDEAPPGRHSSRWLRAVQVSAASGP